MPNPRAPAQLKLLRGTARQDRHYPEPEYEKVTAADPPGWLKGKEARAYWRKMIQTLGSVGVLTVADLEPLAHLCMLHQHLTESEPSAPLLTQYRMFCNEFGLTPASRSKVTPSKAAEADGNPFAKAMRS